MIPKPKNVTAAYNEFLLQLFAPLCESLIRLEVIKAPTPGDLFASLNAGTLPSSLLTLHTTVTKLQLELTPGMPKYAAITAVMQHIDFLYANMPLLKGVRTISDSADRLPV